MAEVITKYAAELGKREAASKEEKPEKKEKEAAHSESLSPRFSSICQYRNSWKSSLASKKFCQVFL